MRLTGSQIVCESLLREGVEVVFGIPGGMILPLYGTLPDYPQLRHILVRHEQGAAHAAEGYARATGKVGVCFTTSGPGATNLVTGLANAYLDSSPMVAITGQVTRPMIGKDGFQEVDITGITLPVTKHNYLVMRTEHLAPVIKEAFHIASTGRPGPVLIDIPRDVFTGEASFSYPEQVNLPAYRPTMYGHPSQIKKAAKLLAESARPVIIAGHGVVISRAYDELLELAEKTQTPVIVTLLGAGCFPTDHILYYGMLGMHGMAYANHAVNDADLVIGIGLRFDDRACGRFADFAPQAQIIHIDIDPAEIGKNIKTHVPIVGDVKNVLYALNQQVQPRTHGDWLRKIEDWRREHPSIAIPDVSNLLPQYVIQQIYEVTQGDGIVVTGVGQHQMWAAQFFRSVRPNCFISSGGLGTMGFELPAAMGAKVGRPQETVWAICGDGGFQMTIQELATIAEENIPVKIAIIDNGYLGMVRQWQEMFYNRRYFAVGLRGPDFVKIAEGYHIPALRVTDKAQVVPAIIQAMEHPGPMLVDFIVEGEENVYPMVAPGFSNVDLIEDPRMKVRP